MLRRDEKPDQVTPYSRLAQIYDYVMRHVDYVHWADYVESVFDRHDLSPVNLLDLACGTGSLAIELRKRAYRVSAADASSEMLAVAAEKVRVAGYDIELYHRDFLNLPGLPRFDTVLCLYDSVNYLMTQEDVRTALDGMHGIVVPGGALVFDVCTETNSVRYFRDMTDRDQGDGFRYVRRSSFEDGVQYNRFEIEFSDSEETYSEEHRQRIYPLGDIQEAIDASPFNLLGAYDGFGFSPASEKSDRVHFVLEA